MIKIFIFEGKWFMPCSIFAELDICRSIKSKKCECMECPIWDQKDFIKHDLKNSVDARRSIFLIKESPVTEKL